MFSLVEKLPLIDVPDHTNDDGAVDVAVLEGDEDFLTVPGTRWPPQLAPATGVMTRSQTPRVWLAGALSDPVG